MVENVLEVAGDVAEETSVLPAEKVYQPWQFKPGCAPGPGRPKGSITAAKLLDVAAPKLTKRLIARSFHSDHVLCKTMDKLVPDAGRTDTIVSVSLTRSDVLAELRRRGITAPSETAN